MMIVHLLIGYVEFIKMYIFFLFFLAHTHTHIYIMLTSHSLSHELLIFSPLIQPMHVPPPPSLQSSTNQTHQESRRKQIPQQPPTQNWALHYLIVSI